jgi:DNA-binding HxlR family transcriptional regulator
MTTPRPCSVAGALAVVGEKYSLLVLREVFFGVRRFNDIARNVGAPRDVLTARLNRLVEEGVLKKIRYSERPVRYEYALTSAGRELREVLLTLMAWGDRHLGDRPPLVLEHSCGADFEPVVVCRACGEAPAPDSFTPRFQVEGWDVRGRAS